ncbi:hypothetical protein NFI95_06210 [Acetobacteraceae bacterium KSS8]|uniref:Uncharacterized protein n=1 Tax=Endosaccharibacter trunci TaxID=2812733 RepID=A0ABT1W580_9PROT|nr:hypothetical protein [Acetobacteraceae bacterium KSS8]
MSFWMMVVLASGAVLALGLLFTLLILALDHDTDDAVPLSRQDDRRWTSII